MGQSKLSIIIPVFNTKAFLPACLDSILNQTYRELEIILVNDGSKDGSEELCRHYASKDPRVQLINQENRGVAAARNRGLEAATGQYLTFVDSDDLLDLNAYEKLVKILEEKEADILEFGYARLDPLGQVSNRYPVTDRELSGPEESCRILLQREGSYPSVCNKLFRSDLIGHLTFADLRYSEDFLFNLQACLACQKKIDLSYCGYYYREHDNMATRPSFRPAKLDILKAGEQALSLLSRDFHQLIPYARLYLLDNCRLLYQQAAESDIPYFDEEQKLLVETFRIHYQAIKKDWSGLPLSKKRKLAFATFYRNPSLYLVLKKLTRFIKA